MNIQSDRFPWEDRMGAWSVAILDSGGTDATEAPYGRNAYEIAYPWSAALQDYFTASA